MSHLDAKPIDARDEDFRRLHPVFQSLFPNQGGRFHQSPSCIPEQDPIDRVVDVGRHTGGVQEAGLQIDRLRHLEFLGCLSSGLEQLARKLTHVGFGPPGGIALEGAFARHADPVDFTDATEKLEQRTIGQAGGELAIALVQELTGEVAAQSTTTVQLALLLSFGTDLLLALSPMFQIGLKELIFQAAASQHLIDLEQLVAESSVIDIAFDGGENLGQRQVKRDNSAGH